MATHAPLITKHIESLSLKLSIPSRRTLSQFYPKISLPSLSDLCFLIVVLSKLVSVECLDVHVHFGSFLRVRDQIFVDVLMSSCGGPRTGSGRKKIHASHSQGIKFWQRGHQRIWLDCQIHSSWVSAKIYCGYRNDSAFAISTILE